MFFVHATKLLLSLPSKECYALFHWHFQPENILFFIDYEGKFADE